ncbi:MAG TPA: hypothetical protein VHI74_06465 [Methyloceanibacter sp.]|jgi:hypothetical protein|nr:hypothetical protein [Methyloceanibacter sp.]
MLIVGSAAALTAIALFLAWVCIQHMRARWRMRQAEKRAASRERQENVERLPAE